MTTTQITGGSVRYTVPSNYSTGKDGCEATIHFTVAEGDGPNAHAMGDLARTEATRLATGADRVVIVGPSRPTEVDLDRRQTTRTSPAASPVGVAPVVVSPVAPEPLPLAVPVGLPQATITDEQLKDAAMHHQARILGAAPKDQVSQETAARKISALIAAYVQPPKTLYSISQDQRQAFLDGLAAL